jgi:hypothetical protein
MTMRQFAKSAASNQQRRIQGDTIADFGGVVEEEHPLGRRSVDLVEGRNCARKGFMLGTRPTIEQDDSDYDAAISTKDCQGIYEFRIAKDATRKLVTVMDGDAYRNDTTILDKTTNTVQITAGADYYWTFATFQNKMFAAGGKPTATVDNFWYYDGTNPLGKIVIASITAGAQYVFQKWNFLFLGGMNGTAYNDNPMCARYCDWGTDATNAANWNINNVIPGSTLTENFGPGSYGEEYNTGFGSFTDNKNDFLLFLTNKRIISFIPNPGVTDNTDAFSVGDSVEVGCVGQDAFVNLGQDVGDAVYMSQNGVHSLAMSKQYGNRVGEYLSWPIRQTFAGLNKSRLKYTKGAYWPDEGLVLFLVSTGSSTTHNKILCMDIRGQKELSPDTVKWYIWDFDSSITLNYITAGRGSDDKPYIYAGDLQGRITRFTRDTYKDVGLAVTVAIQTANDDFKSLTKQKTVGDTFVLMQGNGSYSIRHNYVLQDGQVSGKQSLISVPPTGAVWDTGTWDVSTWGADNQTNRQRIYGVGLSPTIGSRFQHAGLGQPFWIGSLTQEAFVSGPTLDAETNTTT